MNSKCDKCPDWEFCAEAVYNGLSPSCTKEEDDGATLDEDEL